MKSSTATWILVFFLALAWGFDTAQAQKSKRSTGKRKVKVGKTVYDFEEVDILGKLKKPDEGSIVEPPEFRFKRLLDLDESFIPNIIKGVDEF